MTVFSTSLFAQQRLTPEQEKQAGEYARHAFVSMCSNDYWQSFDQSQMGGAKEQAALWDHVQASCKCMIEQIRKIPDIKSSDMLDYVMYAYGFQDEKRPDPNADTFLSSPAGQIIGTAQINPELRKSCGFLTNF
jgi:hypothetical protein